MVLALLGPSVAVARLSSSSAALAARASSTAAARAGVGSMVGKGIFQIYDGVIDQGRCSCDCCVAVPRRPTEALGQRAPKCAPPPVSVARCSERCTMVKDPVLANERGIILTERFCFYRCQPSGDLAPADKAALQQRPDASFRGGYNVDTACVDAPRGQGLLRESAEQDGSGRDAEWPAETRSEGA